jgi:hypothetical protein
LGLAGSEGKFLEEGRNGFHRRIIANERFKKLKEGAHLKNKKPVPFPERAFK